MSGRLALLAAGGTGGHLFPAEALAHALLARGYVVDLVTDERADRYGLPFPARERHVVPSATFASSNPLSVLKTAATLARGVVAARAVIRRTRPSVVVGFGGYPSFPPLVAARLSGVPGVLHEANAVMGRANRALSGLVAAIATSWPETRHVDGALADKARHVGMPVRPLVLAVADTPYPDPSGALSLLVFGGSQGARAFADIVPAALGHLAAPLRARLRVTQQARPEDEERVRRAYAEHGIAAEIAPFFRDLPARMAAAHLVIARSGGSTVAELGVIGRPAVLIPLPGAIDADQLLNARAFEAAGAGLLSEQARTTPNGLALRLEAMLDDPEGLGAMARAAKGLGRPDAAERLADVVDGLSAG